MKRKINMTIILTVGIFLGILTSRWIPGATAEEKTQLAKLFQHMGSHVEGSNSIFNVYCDRQRKNLIYSYVVAVGASPSSNLVVLKDACK